MAHSPTHNRLGRSHSRLLANGGYTKKDMKRFLWEPGRAPFGKIPAGDLRSYSERFLKFYGDCGPGSGVPIADKPEDIVIVVMGVQGTHGLSVQTLLGSLPDRPHHAQGRHAARLAASAGRHSRRMEAAFPSRPLASRFSS